MLHKADFFSDFPTGTVPPGLSGGTKVKSSEVARLERYGRADRSGWSAGRVHVHFDVRPNDRATSRLRTFVIDPPSIRAFAVLTFRGLPRRVFSSQKDSDRRCNAGLELSSKSLHRLPIVPVQVDLIAVRAVCGQMARTDVVERMRHSRHTVTPI
jgi:hypothetical protein